MTEIISSILTVAIIIALLCAMWIGAYKSWKRRGSNEEEAALYERFRQLTHEEMEGYRCYEESFFIISKHAYNGKRKAFKCAYMIGYLSGKGESDNE